MAKVKINITIEEESLKKIDEYLKLRHETWKYRKKSRSEFIEDTVLEKIWEYEHFIIEQPVEEPDDRFTRESDRYF